MSNLSILLCWLELFSKNTGASSAIYHRPDTGWHICSQNCIELLVGSGERCERLDCWKLPAQEQCTCIGVEWVRPLAPNKKSIYARCPFPTRRLFFPNVWQLSARQIRYYAAATACLSTKCNMIVLLDVKAGQTMAGRKQKVRIKNNESQCLAQSGVKNTF